MTCERIEEHLSELIDNELDPQTAEEVNRHLANCPVCRNEFEELRLIVQQSAALEQLDPPDRLYWTIRNKARSGQPRPWFTPRRIGWVLVPALATAALMLMIFPRDHSAVRPKAESVASSEPAMHTDTSGPLALAPVTSQPTPGSSGIRRPESEVVRAAPARHEAIAVPVAASPVMTVAAVQPVASPVVTTRSQPTSEVIASLRNVQQALEEIEGAMQQNPGNVQVQVAYRVTYQKGMELRQRYVLGAR
jgi:anti-sigma factor RsiW